MLCERCGNDISDSAVICSSCGAVTSRSQLQPPTGYGAHPTDNGYTQPNNYNQPPPVQGYQQQGQGYQQQGQGYQQGYQPSNYMPPPMQQPPQQQQQVGYGYAHSYNNQPPPYSASSVNVTVNVDSSSNKESALIVEIIASLFGIYGIGWLMAGETTTGVLLLIGSVVLYWPIFIVGTILTVGLGLFCLGPLAIAAIIVNAILLKQRLDRKASQITIVQQQMRMPPQ